MRKIGTENREFEQHAYTEIKNSVLQGVLPPGTQLVERDLCERLGMSRTPIRNAISRLESEGLLERSKSHRIFVARPTLDDAIHNLYLRMALEGMCCRLAAKNRTSKQLKQLQQLRRQMEHHIALDDYLAVYRYGIELHQLIAESCDNLPLARLASSVLEKAAIYSYLTIQNTIRAVDSAHEHLEMIDCIVSGNCDGAEQIARQHIWGIVETLEAMRDLQAANEKISALKK